MNFRISLYIFLLLMFFSCQEDQNGEIHLKSGLVITKSLTVQQAHYYLTGKDNLEKSMIRIEGKDLVIDFNGAILIGTYEAKSPNNFKGIGIKIMGKNITIKNLIIKGFKVGLLAENVNDLTIENSDFSYNYKERLTENKTEEKGIGVFLKKCDKVVFKNNKITNGQHGIVLEKCNQGQFYNNMIQFNSSIGIALYESNENLITHNKLNWNVGNETATGVLLEGNSKENVIIRNAITHCKNGVIQNVVSENNNLVIENDFSYTTQNGINQEKTTYQLPENIDFIDYKLSKYHPQGEQYILVGEWGVYDFKRPIMWLREENEEEYIFILLGPEGNWKLMNTEGLSYISLKRGNFPTTVVAQKLPNAEKIKIDLQFIGQEITTEFGEVWKKGKPYSFGFE